MRLVILNQHEINPPPVTGGIEKRLKVFIDYLNEKNANFTILPIEEVDKVASDDCVLGFNLNNDICRYLDYREISSVNTITGGFAPNERETKKLFNSQFVKLRFLSEAQTKDYEGCYDKQHSFVLPHGMGLHEFDKPLRTNEYFLWTASLGWGAWAKGLDYFLQLAANNQNNNFVIYGGKWNSERLEMELDKYDKLLDNLTVRYDLADNQKHDVYSRAIALCQFTRLKEAGNTTTLEAMVRNCPVVTLPGVNNASVNEYLGAFNYELKEVNEDFFSWANTFNYNGYENHCKKYSVENELRELLKNY